MNLRIETISNVDGLQRKVLRYVSDQGDAGATSDEIEAALGIGHSTVSPRVRELYIKSYLRDSGLERMTRKGRMATVWILSASSKPIKRRHDFQDVMA
jgi:predicted transcriptional regulator